MISAAEIRQCHSVEDVGRLFAGLGYPEDLLDLETQILFPGRPGSLRAHQLLATPLLGVVLLSGDGIQEAAAELILSFRRMNVAYKLVVVVLEIARRELLLVHCNEARQLRRMNVSLAAPSVAAVDRLNALAIRAGASPQEVRRIFERVIDREGLTQQFFQRFKRCVSVVDQALAASVQNEPPEVLSSQALLLLSRILFLYFIQRKGWLNGCRNFLGQHLDADLSENRSFFKATLRPLFFGCLNTPLSKRTGRARRLGRIPYLNGGLFQPSPLELRHPGLSLANEIWAEVLDSTFERFDFCIDESDQAGTHVDPEMLGRVFESLMEQTERTRSGSFYTPREIVDPFAERALLECLVPKLDEDRHLVEEVLTKGKWLGDRARAEAFRRRLDSMTVLDPACGSGAFLLSALRILERAYRATELVLDLPRHASLRSAIVARSLYGVDLKHEAVRLCELRLWLAIVSESSAEIEDVPPLPNLDRNIQQGNALLGPLDSFATGRPQTYAEWSYALQARKTLLAAYRSESPGDRPAVLRALRKSDLTLATQLLDRDIAADQSERDLLMQVPPTLFAGSSRSRPAREIVKLERRMAEKEQRLESIRRGDLDFFSFEIAFDHVFDGGGFDLVIGNPPWVRHQRLDPDTRALLADRYRSFSRQRTPGVSFTQPDLAVAFVERGLALVRQGGIAAMIVPSKLANASYAASLRAEISGKHELTAVFDWTGEGRKYFAADTFPMGILLRRGNRGPQQGIDVFSGSGIQHSGPPKIEATRRSAAWSLHSPAITGVLTRLSRSLPTMSESLGRSPIMGVKTGANHRFFLRELTFENGYAYESGSQQAIPIDRICRCVRGRDVRRWRAEASTWMRWPDGAAKGGRRSVGEENALTLAYVKPEHLGVKVAWKDISRGMQAVVLPETVRVGSHDIPLIPNQTLYMIDATSLDEAFVLCAILNSTVFNALAAAVCDRAKDFHFRYFASSLRNLPFPAFPMQPQRFSTLARLSRRAHQGCDLDEEIDGEVNALYGLQVAASEDLAQFVAERLRRDR